MKLSPNISLAEMTTTQQTAWKTKNLSEAQARPDVLTALRVLAYGLLQPGRDHFQAPLVVHSGYRCPGLNAAIGGSKTSQHQAGEACDFHIEGVPLVDVFRWYEQSGLRFGQMILEGKKQDQPTWIHLSLGYPYRSLSKSGQVMTWDAARGYRNAAG